MTDNHLNTERSYIYRLLSGCFYEPERDLFLAENLCENLQELLEKTCLEAVPAAKNMGLALETSTQEDLAVEHATLFVGPFELPSPPYGSVYLEKSNRLMGDTTMEVKKLYAEAGLKLDVQEPPDHISFELEFMHYLFNREKEAHVNREGDKATFLSIARNTFLKNYIASWVPRFCEDIRNNTESDFYLNLADCLEIFIHQESLSVTTVNKGGVTTNAYRATV